MSGAYRVAIHDSPRAFRLKVQGELTGACLVETERCWRTAASTIGAREFVVDLAGAAPPAAGSARMLLAEMHRAGARLVGSTPAGAQLAAEITGQPPPAPAPLKSPLRIVRWLRALRQPPQRAAAPEYPGV